MNWSVQDSSSHIQPELVAVCGAQSPKQQAPERPCQLTPSRPHCRSAPRQRRLAERSRGRELSHDSGQAGSAHARTIGYMASDRHQRAWQAAARPLTKREEELRAATVQWELGLLPFQALIKLKDELDALSQFERDLFHKAFHGSSPARCSTASRSPAGSEPRLR